MKYKINEKRILEILKKYDDSFGVDDDEITLEYNNNVFKLETYNIQRIIDNDIDNEYGLFGNIIIEKLHPYFDECFEEIKPKYSYKKCKEFLEENGFFVHENIVGHKRIDNPNDTIVVTRGFDYIIDKLNGDDTVCLNLIGEVITTILQANKDELLEE